jgi:hypothetical protein
MNEYSKLLDDVTPNNVNCRLDRLYKERDRISSSYSRRYDAGIIDNTDLDERYNDACDTIDVLIQFRRKFETCALEGDPEYGFY